MKQFMTGLLAMALLLMGGVPLAMAAQIELKQSDGSVTKLGGTLDAAKVVIYDEAGDPVAGSGSGDGALVDGASALIKATVKDYTNANPLTVIGVDTNGDVTSFGGGTQYTEDAAETAGANLTMAGSVRRDTAASSAGTTGDNATINTDATGRLWVRPTGAVTPAASFTNPTDATTVWSLNGCYNGSTWDPCVKATADTDGVQTVRTHAKLIDRVSGVVGITDGSSTQVVAAQGSGVRFCATTLVVSNSSATNVTVDLRDGTGGSVLMTVPAAANMGGAVVPLPVPICTSANTIFAADPSAAATTVAITAVGFKTSL